MKPSAGESIRSKISRRVDDHRVVDEERRVDLDAELDSGVLTELRRPLVQVVVELLRPQDREAQDPRRLDLRRERLHHLVACHHPIGAPREIDVRAEARRLEAVIVEEPPERPLEVRVDGGEAVDALEPDRLQARPEPELGDFVHELFERVAARKPLVRQRKERRAQLERAHCATSVFARSVTYSSALSGPIRMYGIRFPSRSLTSAWSPARTGFRPRTRSVAASSTNHISSQ
jgi:hypothetical protein